MTPVLLELLLRSILETLLMTGASGLISLVAGLPLGLAIVATDRSGIAENLWLNRLLGAIVNGFRSVPFDTVIRCLSVDDVGVFRDIRLEALSRELGSFASLHEDWTNLSKTEWRQQLEQPVFVAFLNGQSCGIRAQVSARTENDASRDTHQCLCAQGRTRKGDCRKPFACCCGSCTRAWNTAVGTWVNADNSDAIRFYHRHGFERVGQVPRGFLNNGTGSDEVLMMLSLEEALGIANVLGT